MWLFVIFTPNAHAEDTAVVTSTNLPVSDPLQIVDGSTVTVATIH